MANNQYNPAALQDIFNSTATDYSLGVSDDFGASDSVAQLKSQRLAKRTQDKYTRNGVNYDPNQSAILRQGLEDLKSQQIYSRILPTGVIFKYQIDPDTGNEIPWSGEDTRNLYIAESASGGRKLGLARNDLTADARAKGITPFQARYMDKSDIFGLGYNSPYEGDGGDYDGTPGNEGVDPNQNPLLDIELPYQLATDYESQVHNSSGQIKNRMIGQGAIDSNDIFGYGGGKSEYTSLDAPLWNENYTEDGTPIEEGTPLPGQTSRLGNYQKEDTFESIDAFQSSLVQLGGKFAKLLGESYTNVADNFTERKQVGDGALERWGKKVIENADKFTGYNPKTLQKGTRQIQDSYRKFERGDYLSGAIDLISGMANAGPQVVASSLPEVGAIAAASAAGGPASTWATIASLSVANANDTLDKREKLNGGKASNQEIAGVMAAEALATMLDYGAFKFITKLGVPKIQFKGQKGEMDVADFIKKEIPEIDNPIGKMELINALGRTVSRGTGHGMTEFAQESTTEAIRILAAELGTEKHLDEDWVQNLDRNKLDILTSGILGFSGGVGFGAIGNVKDTAKDVGSVIGQINEDNRAKEAGKNVESVQEAEDIIDIRNMDKKSRIATIEKLYPQAQKADKAETVEELIQVVTDVAEHIPKESAAPLAAMIQRLRDPKLSEDEKQQVKVQVQTFIDQGLKSLTKEGRQAGRDTKYLQSAIDMEMLGDRVDITETEATTYVDEEGNTQSTFTGDALDTEINRTEKRVDKESKIFEEATEEAKEANPEATSTIEAAAKAEDLLTTYVDKDGNLLPKYKDSELAIELQTSQDKIDKLMDIVNTKEEGTKEHEEALNDFNNEHNKKEGLKLQLAEADRVKSLKQDSIKVNLELKNTDKKIASIEARIDKEFDEDSARIDDITDFINNNQAKLDTINNKLTTNDPAKPLTAKKRRGLEKNKAKLESKIKKGKLDLDIAKLRQNKERGEAKDTDPELVTLKESKKNLEALAKKQKTTKKRGRGKVLDDEGLAIDAKRQKRIDLEAELETLDKNVNTTKYSEVEAEIEKLGQEILNESKDNAEARRKQQDEKEAPAKKAQSTLDSAVVEKAGKGAQARITRLEKKLSKLLAQKAAEAALKDLEESIDPTDPDIHIENDSTVADLEAEALRIRRTMVPDGIEVRELATTQDIIELVEDINDEIRTLEKSKTDAETALEFDPKNKAYEEDIATLEATIKGYKDHLASIVGIQEKVGIVVGIAAVLRNSGLATIGDLKAHYREKYKDQLAPDDTTQEAEVTKQVKSTKKAAERVTSKTKSLVKRLLSRTDTSTGSAAALKEEFDRRITKLSNKAIEQLMSDENITELVESYKATDGGTQMDAAFFKKTLSNRLRGREASKKHYGIGDTVKGASGSASDIFIAGQIINAKVIIGKLMEGKFEGTEEQADLINQYGTALEDILKAVRNLPIMERGKYIEKIKPSQAELDAGAEAGNSEGLLKALGARDNAIGIWTDFLAANPDTKHIADKIFETIDNIEKELKEELQDKATAKKFLLDVARSAAVELESDVDFARKILEEQTASKDITAKENLLLTRLLNDVQDRSALLQQEIAENTKQEDAKIKEEIDAAIDADEHIDEEQKEYFKNLPANILAQFGLDSEETMQEATDDILEITGLTHEEAFKTIEIDCP